MNPETPETAQSPRTQAQESPAPDRIIVHRFPLRGGFLDVLLPYDLKRAEAERLAQFIEALASQ